MIKKLIAASALLASPLVMAGAANYSVTSITGTGSSIADTTSSNTYLEGVLVGSRHLDSGIAPDISVRDESYIRGSASGNLDISNTVTDYTIVGTIVNATRIGESYMNIDATSTTVGLDVAGSTYLEVGTFTAYDEVGASYSYESGGYTASGLSGTITSYDSVVDSVTDSYSSYGIYGAN